jgi:maltooligosyltrehalose trehalohydrolase
VSADERAWKSRRLGTEPVTEGAVRFTTWAPRVRRVEIDLGGRRHELVRCTDDGMYSVELAAAEGDDYRYVIDGEHALPDPCSRFQPTGLDGPSRVVDPGTFHWSDGDWRGPALDELVLYELHIGTFTRGGTFAAAGDRLKELAALGVTGIELMPVATFPGERNWGYDGVYTYAPHPVYGSPDELARLVDTAHRLGLGVIVDVVYNHIGPGSERVSAFAPYFTAAHTTAWGDALDYSRRGVREWAIQNAEMWVGDYHVDGLRLDAVHAIHDDQVPHVLAELAERVRDIAPNTLVISETETGDLRPVAAWGHDAQWADEVHHVLHVLLTGEQEGYYADYRPSVAALGHQLMRRPPERLVVASQNHDQVGNRAHGDRPARDELRIRAATILFARQTPLLFMGEEYGEQRPFQFFTDHIDPEIAEATRRGRRREFQRFHSFDSEAIPDPQDIATFERSKLDPTAGDVELQRLYARLIALRRVLPRELLAEPQEEKGLLRLRRGSVELVLNFSHEEQEGVPPRDFVLRGLDV